MQKTSVELNHERADLISTPDKTAFPFSVGETITLEFTGEYEISPNAGDDVPYPVFVSEDGRRVNLYDLAGMCINDESLVTANAEDPTNACLTGATSMKQYLLDNARRLPATFRIDKAIPLSTDAESEFWGDDIEAALRVGYKLHGIDTTLEKFPKLYVKSPCMGLNTKNDWVKAYVYVVTPLS
jgi:hypothetical protein